MIRLGVLILFGLAGNLWGSSVLSCSYNGGAFSNSGCYSFATFGFTDSLDWQAAFGTADSVANPHQVYNPITNGAWTATTAAGREVAATLGFNYSGTQTTLSRVDNFQMVYNSGTTNWDFAGFTPAYQNYALYSGMFDAASTPGAASPGDHLLYTNHGQGPLELDFKSGISGALFRISTPTTGDVSATVAAYSVLHPTALDTPIMTYSILATNAAGSCSSLIGAPPSPCNLAPYIGVDGLNLTVHSLIISTNDTAGLLIDTLYMDAVTETPEPATVGIVGFSIVALLLKSRRLGLRR